MSLAPRQPQNASPHNLFRLQNTQVDHRVHPSSPEAIAAPLPHPVWKTWNKPFILGNDSGRACEEAEQQTHKVDINPDKVL